MKKISCVTMTSSTIIIVTRKKKFLHNRHGRVIFILSKNLQNERLFS